MRVDTLTPVLDAAPGESIVGRVRVVNDGLDDAAFTVRVVGLDGHDVVLEVPGGPIGPGLSADVDVPLDVPAVLGVGQHAVALEVSSNRPDDRPALAQLTVSIDSLERVQMAPRPSTVRAGRNGRFTLDVINNETTTVDVLLGGEATDVAVVFDPPTVRLHPGERGWVRGRIRARQRWGGESIHHVLTLTARGRSSTTSTTMAYIQRPVVPGKARNAVAAFVVIAMFLGAIGGGLWWWSQRDTSEMAGETAGRDADGQLDQLDGTGTGTGTGDGSGAGGDAGGEGGAGDAGTDAPPGPGAIPTFTVVTGTVSTSGGDPAGVNVAIAPIELGRAADPDATIVGLAGRSRGPAKIWSARHAVRPSAVNAVRQTESVPAITTAAMSTDGEGVWRFVDIPIRQNYELVFSKPGYDTQSFVVTPPDDGSRVELDVELLPSTGQLSGTVVGPEGPLGGVDIVVTDGTLTFRTTSATEASGAGQVGSFAIEGLSTPAVYTLKASLRGYGTEVLQLPYGAGQERAGTIVSMRPGVGSISGRVTSAGDPRGGVTVVASNGDATFTTTTLTEGDVGAYSIPRLEIPGEYTVTATQPGFITQTRRVDLAGNAAGVDYQMVPTTAGISGRVMSSNGNPIVGAGITVSVDDVGFRSATAASPTPGSFNIDDLPPGTYLVRIARFDHLPFSQQVTVGAGETVDLGTITLEFTARPPIAALGSIAVRVFDSDDADLEGATVSIYALNARAGVDEPIARIADTAGEQSTFVFDDVAVGTYRVRVTRPIYRTVERRVSVGLGREDVQVRMLRLGQASGQIVTADDQPLRGYALNIYRRETSGAETLVESNVSVLSTRLPDEEGKILWESEPDSLVAGTYRIEVINQPPGYEVTPNQVIDPSVTQTPASMLFRVPSDSEEPVVVGDLVADPLPLIGGRLFVPQYAQPTGTTLRPLTVAEVSALPGLDVTLVCGDITIDADVPLVRPTPVEPYDGFELPELANHFEFTPFAIQEANARGECRLDVVADGFVDTSVPLTSPVRPSVGAADPRQRTVNVALMEESNPLFGRVFWVDGTEEIDLVGVDITSGSDTVLGSSPRQGTSFGDTAAPRIDTGSTSTQSGVGGTWDFPRATQLFGAAQYTFTAENFADGVLEVVLDDQSDPAATPDRQLRGLDNLTFTERADNGIDVELLAPAPGPLSGQVRIRTNRAEALFDRVGRRAVGPGSTVDPVPYDEPVAATASTRPLLEPAVAAGTWTVDFALPPNHEFFGVPADQLVTDPGGDPALTVHRVAHRVQPGTGADEFSTDMVELGLVDVDVTFTATPVPPAPSLPDGVTDDVTVHLRGTAGFDDQRDLAPATTTTASFDRLPVDAIDPVDTPAPYRLDVDRPGFDHAAASVVVTDRTNGASVVTGTATGSIDVEFDLRAGTDKLVTVTLPQYGTITGTVIGRGATDEILQFADPLLTVTARRVAGTEVVAVDSDRIVVGDSGDTATSFTLTGPPGTYDITVQHDHYDPKSVPLVDPAVPTSGPLEFVNTNLVRTLLGSNPWKLAVKPGRLDLTALGSLDGDDVRVAVADAKVVLQPQFGGPDIVARTDAQGNVVIDDLLPGTYRLEVRRYAYTAAVPCPVVDPDDLFPVPCTPIPGSWDETTDLAYPVIATITIAPGDTEAERTTVVEVKLPSLTGKIDGTIFAVNSLYDGLDDTSDANRVAAPMPVVRREYVPTAVEVVSGATIPNTAGPTSIDDPVQATTFTTTGEADDLTRGFVFQKVPGGLHRLTFPVPDGYTLDGKGPPDHTEVTIDQNVDDTEDVGDDTKVPVMYRALDVDLIVELDYPGGVEVDDPKVTMVDADGNTIEEGERIGTTTEFRFVNLPPSTTEYRFEVDDVLAQPSTAGLPVLIEVTPNGDGSALSTDEGYAGPVQRETVEMVGSGARVSGTALQQDSETEGTKNIRGPFKIFAESASGVTTMVFERVETTPLPAGKFEAMLPGAGVYTLFVDKEDFVSNRVTVEATLGVTVALDRPLSVRAEGTATITVSNAPAAADANPVSVVGFPVNEPTATITGVRVSNTWTFALTPGVAYRFEVRRDGFYRVLIPSASTSVTPKIGESLPPVTTRLVERVLNVKVDGPAESTGITVSLGLGGPPALSQTRMVGSSTDPLDFVFKSTDAAPLPLTGGSDVTISAAGYRQQVLTGALPNETSDVVPVDAAASSRTVSPPTVTLRPNVTKIGGTITGTHDAVTVSLSRVGGTPETTVSTGSDLDDDENPIAGTNTFEFVSTAFATGTYVASVAILGDGAGSSAAYELTATAPAGSVVSDLDIAFAPRNISVEFTGLPQPGTTSVYDGADDAAVKLTDTTTSTATFQRTERTLAGDYEVRAAGRLWRTIALTLSADDLAGVSREAALTAFPGFSGSVVDADDELVGGASVRLFGGACADVDPSGSALGATVMTTSDDTEPDFGTFGGVTSTAGGRGGGYCLVASEGTRSGTLDVTTSGTLTDREITIRTPPPPPTTTEP